MPILELLQSRMCYDVCIIILQDFYKAASVHNPVENFATMSGTSDIPDWCYVQAGIKYDPSLPPTAEDYAELLSHSPMSACDKVHVPVILSIARHFERRENLRASVKRAQ